MRRFVTRTLLILGSTGVTLLAMEAAVRALDLGPPPLMGTGGASPVIPSEDPIIAWEPSPDSRRSWTYHDRRGGERVVEATVNRHGARGPAFELEKPPGVFRIVALGDSFTYGSGVGDEETWPAALQHSLDRSASVADCEVWNFGVEGYGTEQEIRLLGERILPMGVDPDLVIVCFFINDIEQGQGQLEFEPLSPWKRALLRFCSEAPKGFAKYARSKSRLLEFTAYSISGRIRTGRWARSLAAAFVDGLPAWEKVKAELLLGRDMAREHGFEYVVALYPPLSREGKRLSSYQAYQFFEAWCRSESIHCINLDPVLEKHPVEKFWLHPRNHHPTGECHRIVGEAVGRFLIEHLLVPGN